MPKQGPLKGHQQSSGLLPLVLHHVQILIISNNSPNITDQVGALLCSIPCLNLAGCALSAPMTSSHGRTLIHIVIACRCQGTPHPLNNSHGLSVPSTNLMLGAHGPPGGHQPSFGPPALVAASHARSHDPIPSTTFHMVTSRLKWCSSLLLQIIARVALNYKILLLCFITTYM